MINRDQVAISLLGSLQPNPFDSNHNLDLIKAALDEYGTFLHSVGYSSGYDDGMEYGVNSANPTSWDC